jgi:hypothetical protein|tara:strand:- start:3124 stop:3597 length:474 start_codon:yes stop_codon:yes gene_type:complete
MSLNYFQSRVSQGKINEEFYKPIIEKDINTTLQSNNKFNLFDFENLNFKVELKTREVERMKYKTTIVGYDKIEKGLEFIKEEKRVIFYFGFKSSGLYKFELTDENYLNLKISNVGCRFRNASGKEKLHLEIPVELLEFVSNDCPIQGEYSKRVSKVC